MQVFVGMDIGTAKPSPRIRALIPHHMIDVADPTDDFDVTRFQALARKAVNSVVASGGRIVIVGGSGLHYRVIVDPYTFAPTDRDVRASVDAEPIEAVVSRLTDLDAEAAAHVDLGNKRRVVRALEVWELTGQTPSERARSVEHRMVAQYEPLIKHVAFGVDAGVTAHDRADTRFDAMLAAGFLDEVQSLAGRLGPAASQAVGYKELLSVMDGSVTLESGVASAKQATRALIKRQRTFFRRDPRIAWIPWQDETERRIASTIAAIERATQWTS